MSATAARASPAGYSTSTRYLRRDYRLAGPLGGMLIMGCRGGAHPISALGRAPAHTTPRGKPGSSRRPNASSCWGVRSSRTTGGRRHLSHIRSTIGRSRVVGWCPRRRAGGMDDAGQPDDRRRHRPRVLLRHAESGVQLHTGDHRQRARPALAQSQARHPEPGRQRVRAGAVRPPADQGAAQAEAAAVIRQSGDLRRCVDRGRGP